MRYVTKVIGGILCLVMVLLYMSHPVYAATTDDLRELIGGKRVTEDTLRKEIKQIIYYYNSMEKKQELYEFMKGLGNEREVENYEKLLKDTSVSVKTLIQDFKSAQPSKVIMEDYSNVCTLLKKVNAVSVSDSISPAIYTTNIKEMEDLYQYAVSVKNSIGDNTDIGTIGEELLPPSGKDFQILRTFGENRIILSKPEIRVSDGIVMSVLPNSKVYSQFTGVVDKVQNEGNSYKIIVTSGKSIECVYSGLEKVKVKKGSKVKQYDVLGTVKSSNLKFYIKLNTVYINPLYLYGSKGMAAYERWIETNPEMIVSKTDFSNVLNNTLLKDDTFQGRVSTVNEKGKESEIIWEEGYEAPKIPEK